MRRISEIDIERTGPRRSVVTVTLRSPELARTLTGAGDTIVFAVWIVLSAITLWFAWEGGLGSDAHLIVIVPVNSAVIYWSAYNGNRLWQAINRTTLDELLVGLDERLIAVDGPDGAFVQPRGDAEIRFSSSPASHGTGRAAPGAAGRSSDRLCLP